MHQRIYCLLASTLALSIDVAQAACVAEVFTGDMLGSNQRYFQSVAIAQKAFEKVQVSAVTIGARLKASGG